MSSLIVMVLMSLYFLEMVAVSAQSFRTLVKYESILSIIYVLAFRRGKNIKYVLVVIFLCCLVKIVCAFSHNQLSKTMKKVQKNIYFKSQV